MTMSDSSDPATPQTGSCDNNVSSKEFDRAFEIHKDADSQLHLRISAFILVQSIFLSSFVNAILSLYKEYSNFIAIISLAIIFFGLLIVRIYADHCNRLVLGIEFLKHKYLKKDIIYNEYLIVCRNQKLNDYTMAARILSVIRNIWILLFIFWVCFVVSKFCSFNCVSELFEQIKNKF